MSERILVLLAVGGLAVLSWPLLGRLSLQQARRAPLPAVAVAALSQAPRAILYFWSIGCTQCRALQRPALDQLAAELGAAVTIVPLDAAREAELTAQLGVLTVPATVIVDQRGVRAVNLGYASAAQLRQQLAS